MPPIEWPMMVAEVISRDLRRELVFVANWWREN